MPGMTPYQPVGVQGPEYAAAGQEQYNRNLYNQQLSDQRRAGLTQGLFQLGGAALGGAGAAGGFGNLFSWA